VTNFGTFGLTWATPIPLPEQTLVLGMGAGKMVPHWDQAKGSFVPVTEANLTLSFDHRVLDGMPANQRIAWSLRHIEGEPLENVASLAGCSLATAKRRIAAAAAHIEGAFSDG
jgi:hypothetical protein